MIDQASNSEVMTALNPFMCEHHKIFKLCLANFMHERVNEFIVAKTVALGN